MGSKTGCVLIEHKGHAAPLDLLEKIRANNKSVCAFAVPVEGSNELMIDTFVELPKAAEWVDLRSGFNDFPLVSWWGNSKEGFQEKDIQPWIGLYNEAGKPCMCFFSEGDFTPHAQPKSPMSDEYRLHQSIEAMIKGIADEHDGDLSKIAKAINGSLFKGWWGNQSLTRGFTAFVFGTGEVIVLEKGNDKGQDLPILRISDSYGWKPPTALKGAATSAQAKIAEIKARQAGQSNVVTAQTNPAKMTSAEATVAAAKAAMVGKGFGNTTAVSTGVVPVTEPSDAEEEDTQPTQSSEQPGETGPEGGKEYPPKEMVHIQPKNSKNWSRLMRWYMSHNEGVLPLEKNVLRRMWEKGEALPGVDKGKPLWHHPKETEAAVKQAAEAGEQATVKSFADPKLQNALAKGQPMHLQAPTSKDVAKVMATANDPFMSQARKDKIMEGFIGKDTVLHAVSYDETEMYTPSELNKLDRPKADPLTAFDGVIKDYTGWRWGRSDTAELLVMDPEFGADVIHDLVYRLNLTQLQIAGKIQEPPPAEPSKVPLVGAAARAVQKLAARGFGK